MSEGRQGIETRARPTGGGLLRAGILLLALALAGVAGGVVSAQGESTLPRLFLVLLGEADVPLEVRSATGARWSGRSDAAGRVLFRLAVADDDRLAFRSPAAGWALEAEHELRNAHLDPGIALEIDLSRDLARIESTQAVEPATDAAATAAAATAAAVPDDAADRATPPRDPCADPSRLECRLQRLRRLEEARETGDCAGARRLAEEMERQMPDFVATDAVATVLAEIHLECSFQASRDARSAFDPTNERLLRERAELLARRGLQIAEGLEGRGWCDAARSRVLAAAHDTLRQPAAAAAGAHGAREHCPEETAPVEWEVLFRMRLGQWDRARLAAEDVDGALGQFLRTWVAHESAGCGTLPAFEGEDGESSSGSFGSFDASASALASESASATPCRGLPRWMCRRARIGIVLDCGDERARAGLAAELRRELAAVDEARDAERGLLEDLAEVQYLRGELDEATELFARLETSASDEADARERGVFACRLGSTLLRAQREAEALETFRRAAEHLAPATLDHAVAVNNAVVLGRRVENQVPADALERLAAVVATLEDSDPALAPWRLAFESNLLDLRSRAEADSADAREGLRQLKRLDPELRRHLQSARALATTDPGPARVACSIPAFTDAP